MQQPFWCGAHCYYLFDLKCNNNKYLYYALKSQQDRIMKLRSGACMPNIKKAIYPILNLYMIMTLTINLLLSINWII